MHADNTTQTFLKPYCPGQAPTGARSSSAKNWGWAVTRRECLNGSIIPARGPDPDAKLAAGYQIHLHRALSRPARQWRKLYRARKRTDLYEPRCQVSAAFSRRLQYANLCRRGRTLPMYANLWRLMLGAQSASERSLLCDLSGVTFGFTAQGFSMVGGYTENLKTVKIGGGEGVGAWPGQYGMLVSSHLHFKQQCCLSQQGMEHFATCGN